MGLIMKTAHDLKVEYLRCRVAYLTLRDMLEHPANSAYAPTEHEVERARKASFDAEMAMLKSELALLTNSD